MNISEAQRAAEQFGITGKLYLVKDMARIETVDGVKSIKKINYGIERLMFVHEVKEHLVSRGFRFVDRFHEAPGGCPYVVMNSDVYIMNDWIIGRECDFDNMTHIRCAVETLARFHQYSTGYTPSERVKARNELGRLPAVLKKRSDELLKLKKIAKKGKNRFDYLYMKNVDFFIERSLSSLRIIDSPAYTRIVEIAEKDRGICHRDYSYHNLLFDREGNLHIHNFDYCCFEIRVYDLVSFLRKIMSECNWNVDVAMDVISWYDTVNKLSKDELRIIAALMEYPQKFWRIANRYYNSRRTRPETGFYNKLSDVISEKEFYRDYIKKFKDNIAPEICG